MSHFQRCLASELRHAKLRPDEVSRCLAVMGAHGVSTVGELPANARAVVNELIRKAKQRSEQNV